MDYEEIDTTWANAQVGDLVKDDEEPGPLVGFLPKLSRFGDRYGQYERGDLVSLPPHRVVTLLRPYSDTPVEVNPMDLRVGMVDNPFTVEAVKPAIRVSWRGPGGMHYGWYTADGNDPCTFTVTIPRSTPPPKRTLEDVVLEAVDALPMENTPEGASRSIADAVKAAFPEIKDELEGER